MRGGKDTEKAMSPMFPRLHVNDTEKGGPRAPPRNKMALYEQLSIPSQRFTSGSASTLPRAQNSCGDMVSSTSSGQASANPNTFTQFYNSYVPSFMAQKLHHRFSDGTMLNTMTKDIEKRSARPTNYPSPHATEAAESDSSQAHNLAAFKNFSFKMYENEDDVTGFTNSQQGKEMKKLLSLCSTLHHKSPCENEKSRHLASNHAEENPQVSQKNQDCVERLSPVLVARDKELDDKFELRLTATKDFEKSKPSCASLNQGNYSSIAISDKLHGGKSQPQEEFMALHDKVTYGGNILLNPASARGMFREVSSEMRLEASESCLRKQNGDERSPEWHGDGVVCREQKNCGTPMDRHDGVLEISMVDEISASNVLPDDVVGVIGKKHFWKARRTITYQQRIFQVQVFELHRLITVQRSFAALPDLLHDNSSYLHKPEAKSSPVTKTPVGRVVELPASVDKPKSQPQRPHPSTECNEEDVVTTIPLHSVNTGLIVKQSNYEEPLRNLPSTLTTTNKSVALPFQASPPGNQWLVPVMSPSEGLIYKPYTGPCPPTAGFSVPNYGSCGPMSLDLGSTYRGPACNQQGIGILPGAPPPLGHRTYFPPPYGLPVIEMSPLGVGRANEQEYYQSSFEETNSPKPHQSSCNISSQMSRVKSCRGGAVQPSKGSELQRSTASSPSERRRGEELPLFPVAPTVQEPNENAQTGKRKTPVIKVVPHNPRSANESAARIFQSIQEERKHLRLVSS